MIKSIDDIKNTQMLKNYEGPVNFIGKSELSAKLVSLKQPLL